MLKKWLYVPGKRQAGTKMPNQPHSRTVGQSVKQSWDFANRKRRRGGRGSVAKRKPDGIAMGGR